ncbi:4710_t:CDS:1, partial [Scutellospora calospora]
MSKIIPKLKDYDYNHKYLSFEMNSELLNLDNFKYKEENKIVTDQIKIFFTKEDHIEKQAFLINKRK